MLIRLSISLFLFYTERIEGECHEPYDLSLMSPNLKKRLNDGQLMMTPVSKTDTMLNVFGSLTDATYASRLIPTTKGGTYTCKKCGNAYARPHSLSRHLRFECGVEPQFECPVCHKKSKHKHNLVLHMRTHQNR